MPTGSSQNRTLLECGRSGPLRPFVWRLELGGIIKTISIAVLTVIISSANVWAQATAQISGTVRDQSGAVLPGVEVTATQTDTGIPRSVVTNETGSYVLSNLALGPYRLEAALPGF